MKERIRGANLEAMVEACEDNVVTLVAEDYYANELREFLITRNIELAGEGVFMLDWPEDQEAVGVIAWQHSDTAQRIIGMTGIDWYVS